MQHKKMYSETIVYFVGTVSVSILGFAISLLYSKLFDPSDYGIYSLVAGGYGLISSVYGGWMAQSIIRSYEKYKGKDEFKCSIFQGHFVMSIVFFLGMMFFVKIANLGNLYNKLLIIMGIVYFFEYFILIINTFLRCEGDAKQYSWNTTRNNLLKIIFLLVLYYIIDIRSIIVICGSILLAEMVQSVYLAIKFKVYKYLFEHNFKLFIFKKLFLFGFPLMGVAITSWILNFSDRFVIKLYYSEAEVGLYSYASSLATSIFNMLVQFIMLGAFPNIIKAWEKGGKREASSVLENYLHIYIIILLPSIFGVMAVANNLFIVLTDSRYHQSFPIFIMSSIGTFILGLTQYTNKAWEVTNKTKNVLFLNIMTAILNILLNIILVPLVGYQMAAATTVISYFIYLLISLRATRNILPIKVNRIIVLKILVSCITMFLFITLLNYIFGTYTLWGLLLKILGGGAIYVIMILVLKCIKIEEIKKLLRG